MQNQIERPAYQVSARKWRPQTFEDVIGQKHVTTSLANAIRLDKIAQAYLFSGIRGVGKTSLARILAKGINCLREGKQVPCNQCEICLEITEGRSVDVVEVDGASNTGVDDVRDLRENVKYLPLRGRYKIYIIDEVHMLSNAAFNALLKTLEEPPPHLIFILATTESHKIPATVLSRCQHFSFRRMRPSEIIGQLGRVAEEKQAKFSEKGLRFIASASDGSMRDGLSLLDQAISFSGAQVSDEDLLNLLGRIDPSAFHTLVGAISRKDASAALKLAKEITDKGCDLRQFLNDWLEHLRHLIISQNISGESGHAELEDWIDLPKEGIEEIRSEAALFSKEALQRLFSLFVRLQRDIRNTPQPTLLFEVTLMKAILLSDLQPIETLLEDLDRLAKGTSTRQPLDPEKPRLESKAPAPSVGRQGTKEVNEKSLQSESPLKTPLAKPNLQGLKGEEKWRTLLSAMKQERPNIASYLEQGVFLDLSDHEIRLSYSEYNAFLMPLILKEDNKEWLNSFIRAQLHSEAKLVLQQSKTTPSPVPESPVHSKPPPSFMETPELGAVKNPSSHPLIQEVLKVMGGRLIETKPILTDQPLK